MARTAVANRIAHTRTGNILYNGGFEVKPAYTADTNTAGRWIDGTASGSNAQFGFGWAAPVTGSGLGANAAAAFDTSQSRSGTASMRLSTLNASGAVTIGIYKTDITSTSSTKRPLILLSPNTSYTLTGYIRTNNVATSGAFIDLRQYNAAGTTITTTSTNKLSGTDSTWRQVTLAVTTDATAVFGNVFLRNNVTGNTSDAWFDDITLISNAGTGRSAASGRVAA